MKKFTFILLFIISVLSVKAEYTFMTGSALVLGFGSNEFAPFYLRANHHGKITQSENLYFDLWAVDSLEMTKRFDFFWGAEVMMGAANKVDYRQWDTETKSFIKNPQGPASLWVQQLYAGIKWRSLFLTVGLKDWDSAFVDQNLSSGDLLWSGNSRGIPEVRIGFVDFQNVPLTKKFLQFEAVLSYGKFFDGKWMDNHFDYWSGKINKGTLWTYKRASLRSKTTNPFMLQMGFQMSGLFGGTTYTYAEGKIKSAIDYYTGIKDFFYMLLPISYQGNGEGYRVGDHKGTWDVSARYRFKDNKVVRAYFQWFWEDSSGLSKQNGWDGLWGLEFKMNKRWWVNGTVVEYLDLTHMSGPLGYDPGYHPGDLPYKVDGRDGYYNSSYYNAYANYGLNMGTPMVQGTLFNTGDNPDIRTNDLIPYFRVRAIHLAVEGSLTPNLDYIVKYNHRKAWGDTNTYTLLHPAKADSFMIGLAYSFPNFPGLTIKGAFGVDHGNLPQNSIGGIINASYVLPVTF